MSHEEIARKLTDWLLCMGCPSERIPAQEKMEQMCRGQFSMVWRNMIEHVTSKQVIEEKRLQVFVDDIRICKEKSATWKKYDNKLPDELIVWQEHKEINDKLQVTESRVIQLKKGLAEISKKESIKSAQCEMVQNRIDNLKRRVSLLQCLKEEVSSLRGNLNTTQSIATTFQRNEDTINIQPKIEKSMKLLSRQNSQNSSKCASTSIMSENNDKDTDEQLSVLMSIPGGVLWSELYERRVALVERLSAINSQTLPTKSSSPNAAKLTAESVLAHSAALHCMLALEAIKQQNLLNNLLDVMENTLQQSHSTISEESRELFVLRCERAKAQARVATLRAQLEEISAGRGSYSVGVPLPDTSAGSTMRQITSIDRSMESMKSELKRMTASLIRTEQRILNVRNNLQEIFNVLQKDITDVSDSNEVMTITRQFYEQRKSNNKSKVELSLNISDSSFNDGRELKQEPTFSDELRFYLKQFNLENNRKLVFDCGETMWMFETLQEAVSRLQMKCLGDMKTTFVWPSLPVHMNLESFMVDILWNSSQLVFLERLRNNKFDYNCNEICDISPLTRIIEVDKIRDKVKKHLSDNLIRLNKVDKDVAVVQENLNLWSDNKWKEYLSEDRRIDGRTYKYYEKYMENSM